jgi:hypothetical protein
MDIKKALCHFQHSVTLSELSGTLEGRLTVHTSPVNAHAPRVGGRVRFFSGTRAVSARLALARKGPFSGVFWRGITRHGRMDHGHAHTALPCFRESLSSGQAPCLTPSPYGKPRMPPDGAANISRHGKSTR